jgi:transcriptional regulator with XRE-family HTH domain
MSLTQSDLAGMIGRSPATIKAVETGKLALSEKLATLISSVTGGDKKWLLENNLKAPMPPLTRVSATWTPEEEAYAWTWVLLMDLLGRLFAVCRRLREGDGRKVLPIFIKDQLRILEETGYEPGAVPTHRGRVEVFEFFKTHPELLDPDLGRLINLDFLIKDTYRARRIEKREDFKLAKEARELQKPSSFFSHDGVLSETPKSASETRSRQRRKGSRPSRKSS